MGKNGFIPKEKLLKNKLPSDIKEINSVTLFNKKLKQYMLKTY